MTTYIVGAGGVGSLLIPSLRLLIKGDIGIIDGDRLEKSNLSRQLFSEKDIGKNKAEALCERFKAKPFPKYLQYDEEWYDILFDDDVVFVCVDNHPARSAALALSDQIGFKVIIAANEKTSAEAYFYQRLWRGSSLDPRTYYPQIDTDHGDDPTVQATPCTGDAQRRVVQLVSANYMAAALAQHLYVLWMMEAKKLSREVIDSLPHHLRANMTKLETIRAKDLVKPKDRK